MAEAQETATKQRNRRKTVEGVVVSDKMEKSITVEIERLEKHRLYKKYIRRRTKLHAHDENNDARAGDTVRITETRPMSKLKRWRLVEILKRGE